MAKINRKNVALIVGITVFDIGIGLYDRLVNGVGVINAISGLGLPAGDMSQIQAFNQTSITVLSNTGTVFNFLALGLFVLAATFVIAIVAGVMGSAGGRE